jgi:hypothetical protein
MKQKENVAIARRHKYTSAAQSRKTNLSPRNQLQLKNELLFVFALLLLLLLRLRHPLLNILRTNLPFSAARQLIFRS